MAAFVSRAGRGLGRRLPLGPRRPELRPPTRAANAKSSNSPDASSVARPRDLASASPRSSRHGLHRQGRAARRAQGRSTSTRRPCAPEPQLLPPVAEFTVATFNILGSSHTAAGGHCPGLASGPQRIGGALAILAHHDISVVGHPGVPARPARGVQQPRRGWSLYPGLRWAAAPARTPSPGATDTWELVEPEAGQHPLLQRPASGRCPTCCCGTRRPASRRTSRPSTTPPTSAGNMQRYRNEATDRRDQPVQPARGHRHPAVRHR